MDYEYDLYSQDTYTNYNHLDDQVPSDKKSKKKKKKHKHSKHSEHDSQKQSVSQRHHKHHKGRKKIRVTEDGLNDSQDFAYSSINDDGFVSVASHRTPSATGSTLRQKLGLAHHPSHGYPPFTLPK